MNTNTKKPQKQSVFLKMLEDKKAISECIRTGGNLTHSTPTILKKSV